MPGLDDLIDAANWYDRVAGILSCLAQGQMGRQIRIERRGATMTGAQYADVLRRYRIATWWKRSTDKHLIFNVRVDQWQWAVDLLAIAGAPMEHQARPWAAKRLGQLPEPWEVRR